MKRRTFNKLLGAGLLAGSAIQPRPAVMFSAQLVA